MKRTLSWIMAVAMVLAMFPVFSAEAAADPVILTSATDVAATEAQPATYTWTAEANGTLTVSMAKASPGWSFEIKDSAGNTVDRPRQSSLAKSIDIELVAGTEYTFKAFSFNTSTWEAANGTISYTLSFVAAEGEAEVVVEEYQVSDTALVLGDNSLSLLETAVTTIYVFEPTETAVYTFTAPAGAILGYWGAGSWFLSNPNSTTNTYEWTCTSVGQCAYMGVSGVEGTFNLNIEKTGDYTVVETPIIPYENKAQLSAFTVPEGSKFGSYIDVTAETKYAAVLGEDGYYHLDSEDGPVILVDMNYQDIVLSNALKSDRPVMYAYTTDEEGNNVKYDIGNAILAYEEVMDENGYYPLTEDLILFYDTYAVGASIYSFFVSSYNPENVWLYCMRTITFPEVTEPSEPEVTEPSEPEVTEPSEPEVTDPSEPEVTEPSTPSDPADGIIVLQESVSGTSGTKYVHKYKAEEDGKLLITVGDGTVSWNSDVGYFVNLSLQIIASASGTNEGTYEVAVTAGTTYHIRVWTTGGTATPLTVVFQSDAGTSTDPEPDITEPEVTKNAYEVSGTELTAGSNALTMLDTAITTVFKFKPTATGTYTFTAPEGAIVGNWGSNAYYLTDPNSTVSTCQWTCSGVGQSVFIGVSGIEGSFVLNVELQEPEEPEITEPSEPEVTEPSEPEVTEPSEPEVTEPSEPEVTEPSTPELPSDAIYVSNSTELKNALESNTSATIVLNQNIDLGANTVTVPAGNSIVLDLNGYTLTAKKNSGGTVTVNGILTVQDSSVAGTGLIQNTATSGDRAIVTSGASASLTLKSGNFAATTQTIRIDGGSFLMEGGNVTAKTYAVYIGANCTGTITGGTATVTGEGDYVYPLYCSGSATVSVSGGYFNGPKIYGSSLTGKISGGYFTIPLTASYIAADCEIQSNDDPVYLYKVVNPNAEPEEPDVTEPAEVVDRWNLVLDDNLKVNFYVNMDANAQVQVTVAGQSTIYDAAKLEVTEDGKYLVSISVAASQMTNKITVAVVGNEANAKEYTIRQYADTVLADSKLSAYHALIKEMLNYGAAAQNYFGYNTTTLANTDITGTGAANVPETTTEYSASGSIPGVAFYGASLVHRDKIAVRFYFSGDVSGLTFTEATGKTCIMGENNGMTYVEIDNILPQDLDQLISLTVTDANGNTISVAYSPMNYMVRMNMKGDDNLKALMKALYNYHLAAKALRIPA